MKTIMTHDELVEGVNWFPGQRDEVIPAGGSTRQRPSEAVARFRTLCVAAQLSAKLDRAAELLTRDTALREQQKARRNMPVGSLPGVLSEREMADQWWKDYQAHKAQICADQKAAYDARNPHKRKEAQG